MRCEINDYGISVGSDTPAFPPLFSAVRFFNCGNITGLLALLTSFSALQIFLWQIVLELLRAGAAMPEPVSPGSIFRILCAGGIALCLASAVLAAFSVTYYTANRTIRMRCLVGFISSLVSVVITLTAVFFCVFLLL